MSQPVRLHVNGDDVYYGFGPDCTEVEYMTSEHKRGHEPYGAIVVFGRMWIAERGSTCWDGVARLSWTLV